MHVPADTVGGTSAAVLGHIPVRPPGEKQPRMHFRPAATATAAVRPVGVHEIHVFEAAAEELPTGAPVLHSVVHTHRQFSSPPSSSPEQRGGAAAGKAEGGADADNETDVKAELQRISREIDQWKLQRVRREREGLSTALKARAVESEMEQRIFGKRVQEQDRALRRLHELLSTMEALGEKCRETVSRPAPASSAVLPDGDAATERQEAILRERMAASAWLVERHLHGKREARAACERDCLLKGQSITYEEEAARMALLLERLNHSARSQFADDERFFRAQLYEREAEKRQAVTDSARALLREAERANLNTSLNVAVAFAAAAPLDEISMGSDEDEEESGEKLASLEESQTSGDFTASQDIADGSA